MNEADKRTLVLMLITMRDNAFNTLNTLRAKTIDVTPREYIDVMRWNGYRALHAAHEFEIATGILTALDAERPLDEIIHERDGLLRNLARTAQAGAMDQVVLVIEMSVLAGILQRLESFRG